MDRSDVHLTRTRWWALPFKHDRGLIYYNTAPSFPRVSPSTWSAIETRRPRSSSPAPTFLELRAGYAGQFGDSEAYTVNHWS